MIGTGRNLGQPKEGEIGVGSIDLHNGEICRPICMLGLRLVSSETKIGWLLGAADLPASEWWPTIDSKSGL